MQVRALEGNCDDDNQRRDEPRSGFTQTPRREEKVSPDAVILFVLKLAADSANTEKCSKSLLAFAVYAR